MSPTSSSARRTAAVWWTTGVLIACGVAIGCRGACPEASAGNVLPFGVVELPAPDAVVERQMVTRGWALDEGEVVAVRFFIDGRFVAGTTLTEARPDVRAAYPAQARDRDVHGWALSIGLPPDLRAGRHTVIVQAVDDQGGTRDLAAVPVTVLDN